MRHRTFLVLAAGLAGLVAVAPVLAAEDTAPTPPPGAAASSSSSSTMPGSTPTSATTATTAPMEDDEASDPSTDADADTGASDPTTDSDASDPTTDEDTSDPAADDDVSGPAADDDVSGPAADDDVSDPAAEDDEAAPSEGCSEPEMQEIPAPEPGTSQTFDAGAAGIVEIERTSASELHIISATPNDGWTEKIATPSGPRVKGKFTNNTDPAQVVRFAASLNSDGTVLRMKVTDCG